MSRPVEDILRDLAKSGRLNHVSISFLHGGGWEVSYRGVKHEDHRRETRADIVCALRAALTGRAGDAPPKRKAPAPPPADDGDLLV